MSNLVKNSMQKRFCKYIYIYSFVLYWIWFKSLKSLVLSLSHGSPWRAVLGVSSFLYQFGLCLSEVCMFVCISSHTSPTSVSNWWVPLFKKLVIQVGRKEVKLNLATIFCRHFVRQTQTWVKSTIGNFPPSGHDPWSFCELEVLSSFAQLSL